MAKNTSKKIKELKGIKPEKITDEQLKKVQETVNAIPQLQAQLKEFQDKLEEAYGKVSINIQDGTIQEIPEEDEQANT